MIDKKLIHQAAEDIDIFEADLTEEYERLCKRKGKPSALVIALGTVSAIAAVLLVGFFLFVRQPKEQPVVAEVQQTEAQEEPLSEPINIEQENKVQVAEKHNVPKRATRHVKKRHITRQVEPLNVPSSETTLATTAEEVQTATETEPETHPTRNAPEVSEQYLLAAAQAQDIRSRGERLSQEVALLIEP
ncbi:MAG: hypothetical protein IJS63_10175 [Bacteroidaceae bacterium]|nr:hypothetical protein [Bacteroidaceae bacterium]